MRPEEIERNILQVASRAEATEVVVFAREDDGLRTVLHCRPDDSSMELRRQAISCFREIIESCLRERRDGAIRVSEPRADGSAQYCIVVLVREAQEVIGAAGFIVRRNSEDEAILALRDIRRGTTA